MKRPYPKDKIIIALTGGIATGKSFVSDTLKELGAGLVDTDKIARQVVSQGSPILNTIRETWGDEVINPDGTLNRKKLGEIIFSSKKDRNRLNSIMHPEIRRVMYEQIKNSPQKIVFIDIPLLFEAKIPIPHDKSWLVYCSKKQQKQRLMKRDSIDENEAQKKIDSQIDIDKKREMVDVVIDNCGSKEETYSMIRELYKELTAE